MVEKECQHLPSGDYLKRLRNGDLGLGARKEAVDWIAKVGSFLFLFIFSLQFDVILDVLK
jgi:cyclin D1/2/4